MSNRAESAGATEPSVARDFDAYFRYLTDSRPFPWQRALYERFIANRADNIPASCNIPTGLGKTSVIAIWLIARITHPARVPRRLVYVVNRRTVVDQTTAEAEKLRLNLPKLNSTLGELAISTLRGQFADNREWSADPSRVAVICGTVDMIGSRLLFSGYRAGFKARPLQAGFLGQDALLVHDEAHLAPAFQRLLSDIQKEQEHCKDLRPLRVMELSATSRGEGKVFGLTLSDRAAHTVRLRIHAKKTLAFHSTDDEKKKLADKLVELALVHQDSQQAILLFVRTVDDLAKVVGGLPKGRVLQLTGTMRGLERETLVHQPLFCRFLPRSSQPKDVTPAAGTVYLVCTSAGEVGVNISADHLVCDLSTLDSMIQRFGRVNRFGSCIGGARIDIVAPAAFEKDDKLDSARERALALLKALNADASPANIDELMQSVPDAERTAAFAPEPSILPTSGILFDAWALTTIRDKLPGRPPVANYLHGIADWEPPQTFVAWRSEVGELMDKGFKSERHRREYAAELLEDYPLKTHEFLRDRSNRVLTSLRKLTAPPTTPIWILEDARVIVTTLGVLANVNANALDEKTVLLPPQAGGLSFGANGNPTGLLDPGEIFYPKRKDFYDVADEWRGPGGLPLRKRRWDDDTRPTGMKLERVIVFESPDDEERSRSWYWFVRHDAAEADAKGARDYPLDRHLSDVRTEAERIVLNLSLSTDIRDAVIFAAASHDLGKDRARWQREVGNSDYPAQKWAKSGRRQAATERSSYRHEFGSMLDVQAMPDFARLSPDAQELALHLIAAHHGRARPYFLAEEELDENYPDQVVQSLAIEVLQRYARLQRKYGRWGLAYLESLVRAADYMASQKAARVEESRS